MSFDDDAFEDDDDDVTIGGAHDDVIIKKGANSSSSSTKEPSIDSCIDALDIQGHGGTEGQSQHQGQTTLEQQTNHNHSSQQITNTQQTASESLTMNNESNSSTKPASRQTSDEFEVVSSTDVTSAIVSEKNAALQALLGKSIMCLGVCFASTYILGIL